MTFLHLTTALEKMLDADVVVASRDRAIVAGRLYAVTRLAQNADAPTALVVDEDDIEGLTVVPWHAVDRVHRRTASDSARRNETPKTGNPIADDLHE